MNTSTQGKKHAVRSGEGSSQTGSEQRRRWFYELHSIDGAPTYVDVWVELLSEDIGEGRSDDLVASELGLAIDAAASRIDREVAWWFGVASATVSHAVRLCRESLVLYRDVRVARFRLIPLYQQPTHLLTWVCPIRGRQQVSVSPEGTAMLTRESCLRSGVVVGRCPGGKLEVLQGIRRWEVQEAAGPHDLWSMERIKSRAIPEQGQDAPGSYGINIPPATYVLEVRSDEPPAVTGPRGERVGGALLPALLAVVDGDATRLLLSPEEALAALVERHSKITAG